MNEKVLEENLLHFFSELKCWIDGFMNNLKEELIKKIKRELNGA